MSAQPPIAVTLRPWSSGDLGLLERLMGDPRMTAHLGGPETPEKIRQRHARYCQPSIDKMFVILAGPQQIAAGAIGYWQRQWRGQAIWETGWSVLPEFQGQGIATQAIRATVELARVDAQAMQRFMHAFPDVDNGPSNAICRKAGFTLLEQVDFEYPPGSFMRCNDWQLDLFPNHLEEPHI